MIVAISSLITLVGLWFILRKYFTITTSLVTLMLLFFGTTFFLMMVYSAAIQASILLALVTLVVWMTQRWYEKPRWMEATIAGLAMGCLIFIKPEGIASILLFFFWGAYNRETFSKKWSIYKANIQQIGLIYGLFVAGLTFRLIFPQAFEGTWFCDYVMHKRVFYFLAPNLWLVLFSIKNGWLIYTPIVLFSLPGFYLLAERNKPIFYSTFLFSLTFLLVLASSPDVTEPVSFSQSRMTEIFAVLFIPIGYFISWVANGHWIRKVGYGAIFLALIGLNLFQTWQYRVKIINPWFITPAYYKAVFLRTHIGDKERNLMDFNNIDESSWITNEPADIKTLYYNDFESGAGGVDGHVTGDLYRNGKYSFRLDSNKRFLTYFVKLIELPQKAALGIRSQVNVLSEIPFENNPILLVIALQHKGRLYRYKALNLAEAKLKPGHWNEAKFYYVIPKIWDPEDYLVTQVWYPGKSRIYVDDFKVELFEPKER